jgi:monovalent cation:H+ antiporter-2, CPA2 family
LIVGIGFVGNLGYLLLVCSAVGALAYILKQPIILGFLIAGIYSLALSAHLASSDTEMLNNFSDLAIVLLLFGVGLSFPLKQLGAIGRIGSSIAGIEVLVMLELALQLEALMDDHFMMQCSWQLRPRQAPLP